MLSPADAAVARRDPEVPGLATVLDPAALVAALRASAPQAAVTGAAAFYVRYKPGTSCVVGYRLSTPDATVDAYAKAHRRGDSTKANKIVEGARVAGPWGRGAMLTAEGHVVVCSSANDRRLPGVRRLAEAAGRRRLLTRLLPRCPDAWDGALQRLRYKPERRYVARVDGPDGPVATVKCYSDGEFETAAAATAAFRSDGPLRIASAAGASRRRRALAVEWQAGRPLPDVIGEGAGATDAVAAVGQALARLHDQTGRGLRPLDRRADALPVLAAAQSVAVVAPELAHDALVLGDRLAAALLALPERGASIHGDFSADQVLLAGADVAIIDYDAARVGDPAADLGLFRASLLRDFVDGRIGRDEVEWLTSALVDGYGSCPGPRLAVHTAAWLLRLAAEPFRHRRPDWPDRTATLIGLAREASEG